MNMNPFQIAQQLTQRNPNIANNPNAQNMLNVLMSGDRQAGEQLANNLLNSTGMTKEQAMQQVQQMMGRMGFR